MKKLIPFLPMQPHGIEKLLALYSLGVIVPILSGCTTTHAEWDASQMRYGVVDYYNDQIMDNLIRAIHGEPFVHVDISGLQAVAISKVSATVNGGQTLNNTGTRTLTKQPSTVATTKDALGNTVSTVTTVAGAAIGVAGTITHLAIRPFTVSVNPERDDNVTINSVPLIGGTSESNNIYNLYLKFLNLDGSDSADFEYLTRGCKTVQWTCALSDRLSLRKIDCVPGTVKQRGGCLYYVPSKYQKQYLDLFRNILIGKRPGESGKSAAPGNPVPTYSL